jgi:hypothetical protein
MSMASVLAFSRAALEFLKGGGALVDKEEMKRRTDICVSCPHNQVLSGCRCAFLFRTIGAVLPKDRVNPELHVCEVCACSLPVKCSVPAAVIKASEEGRELDYPGHCWVPSAQGEAT